MSEPIITSIDFEIIESIPASIRLISVDAESDDYSLLARVVDEAGLPVRNAKCLVYYGSSKYVTRTNSLGYAYMYHNVGQPNTITVELRGYKTYSRSLTTQESANSLLTLDIVLPRLYSPSLSASGRLVSPNALAAGVSRYRRATTIYFNLAAGTVVADGSNRVSRVNDLHGSAYYLANPTVDKQPLLSSEGLVFDTVNDWLRLEPNNFSLSGTDFAVAFWVKTRVSAVDAAARIVSLTDNVINVASCAFKPNTADVMQFTDSTSTYERQMLPGYNHVAMVYEARDNSVTFYLNGIIVVSGVNPVVFDFSACVLLFGNTPTVSMGSTIRDIVVSRSLLYNRIGYTAGQQAFAPPLRAMERWLSGQWVDFSTIDKSKVKVCLHSRTSLAKSGNTVTGWTDTTKPAAYTVSNGNVTNDATGGGVVMSAASLLCGSTVSIDAAKFDISMWYYQAVYSTGGILYLYSNATNNVTMKNTATGFDVSVNGVVKATVVNALNAWTHIRVVAVAGKLHVFANGVLAATVASVVSNTFTCTPRVGYNAMAYLTGRVDALLVHDDVTFDPLSNADVVIGRRYFTPPCRNSL